MKKLTNKKGFTLIEMLVVIAIIAVLVAIIIPIVTNSTDKAAAAANAANMRSYKAEIVTSYLSNDGKVEVNGTSVTCSIKAPAMKQVKAGAAACSEIAAGETPAASGTSGWVLTYDTTNSDFVLTYDGHSIDAFAGVAGSSGDKTNSGEGEGA